MAKGQSGIRFRRARKPAGCWPKLRSWGGSVGPASVGARGPMRAARPPLSGSTAVNLGLAVPIHCSQGGAGAWTISAGADSRSVPGCSAKDDSIAWTPWRSASWASISSPRRSADRDSPGASPDGTEAGMPGPYADGAQMCPAGPATDCASRRGRGASPEWAMWLESAKGNSGRTKATDRRREGSGSAVSGAAKHSSPEAGSIRISAPGIGFPSGRAALARAGATCKGTWGAGARGGTAAAIGFTGAMRTAQDGWKRTGSSIARFFDSGGGSSCFSAGATISTVGSSSRVATFSKVATAPPVEGSCPLVASRVLRDGGAEARSRDRGAGGKFWASDSNPPFADAGPEAALGEAGGAVHVGHSRMAGEHSCPHSGQIQYSIYIHSRTKVLLYLSVTHPTLF